uniref:Uncharacterized protein n=1 Tax=Manihot esculenta TaxID=3983 RepID=A0A2C9WNU7_MANES
MLLTVDSQGVVDASGGSSSFGQCLPWALPLSPPGYAFLLLSLTIWILGSMDVLVRWIFPVSDVPLGFRCGSVRPDSVKVGGVLVFDGDPFG